jgi:hypothetical protein
MRRLILLFLAIAAILPAQAMGQKPKLAATLLSCSSGATAPERSLTVSASMPASAATARMWMRFELLQKLPTAGAVYERVKLPAWNPWTKSDPDVPGLVFQRTVDSLVSPASYKVRVRFRWYDADGKRIKTKIRTTKACRQTAPAVSASPAQ